MLDKLEEYFKLCGIDDEKKIFEKTAEIDVLLTIIAFDRTYVSIHEGLVANWVRITGKEPTTNDKEFIETYDYRKFPMTMLDDIKKYSFKNSFRKEEYIRTVWFFLFLAKNYSTVNKTQLTEQIKLIKKKEIQCGYLYSENSIYKLDKLLWLYNTKPTVAARNDFAKLLNEVYLNDLDNIFNHSIEILSKTDLKKYENLIKILSLIPFENIPLTITKKTVEKNIEQKPIEKVDAETTQKTGESKTIKTDKSTDTDNEQQSVSAEDAASLQDKQSTEEVHALIKHLENEQHENPSLEFERAIDKVVDLSQILSDSLKNDGLESFAKTLNSTAYANLLDKVYFATSEKEEMSKDFVSIAIQLKNALSEFGYSFEYYPKESLGCCIGAPSDDDIEYISNNYRWKSDNILYKNLYISAPGLMNRRTKTFVYPPLVEVK